MNNKDNIDFNNKLMKNWYRTLGKKIASNLADELVNCGKVEYVPAKLKPVKLNINWSVDETFSYTRPQHDIPDVGYGLSSSKHGNYDYIKVPTKVCFITSYNTSQPFKFAPSTEEHQPSDEQNYDRAMSLLHKL